MAQYTIYDQDIETTYAYEQDMLDWHMSEKWSIGKYFIVTDTITNIQNKYIKNYDGSWLVVAIL